MLKWLLGSKLRKTAENDILVARQTLSTMKLKLYKERPEVVRLYGEGISEVAGLMAQRFGISVPDALVGRGLDWRQLDDASHDLAASAKKLDRLLSSEAQSAHTIAHKQSAGCLVLGQLYRLRFLTEHAPSGQQSEAAVTADRFAQFARIMAEIGAGTRDPADAYD
jgi:hypothetical protein